MLFSQGWAWKLPFLTWMSVIIRSQQSWVNLCVAYLWKREIIWRWQSAHIVTAMTIFVCSRKTTDTASSHPYDPPHQQPVPPSWDVPPLLGDFLPASPLRRVQPLRVWLPDRGSGQSAKGGPGRRRSGAWKLAYVIMSHRDTSISPICHTVKLGVGGVKKSPL